MREAALEAYRPSLASALLEIVDSDLQAVLQQMWFCDTLAKKGLNAKDGQQERDASSDSEAAGRWFDLELA